MTRCADGYGEATSQSARGSIVLAREVILRLAAACVVVASLAGGMPAAAAELNADPVALGSPVAETWYRLDGPVAFEGANRSWLLGPAVRSVAVEPYRDAASGTRLVAYFDKGRVEAAGAADGSGRVTVTLGLLVREMIAGQIQVGDTARIPVEPAAIPIVGDLAGNDRTPTYAALRRLASVGPDAGARRHPNRVGQPVTALLDADGQVHEGAVPESAVLIGAYEETLGHNVPLVFWEWMHALPVPWPQVVGLPLTEPYWVDTVVDGQLQRVLVQAFERRVLTYVPDNPPGWQVEANNAGIHYRIWRRLELPDDRGLLGLASGVPLGETIVPVAVEYDIDPYLFAALAAVTSGFDPAATAPGVALGLFQVPVSVAKQTSAAHPLDPAVNAALAATELSRLANEVGDWNAAVARYLATARISADAARVFETAQEFRSTYREAPSIREQGAYRFLGRGHAAYYAPGYTVAWWENALALHAGWGNAVPGWQPDPDGYYCVHPDFRPGQRLLLTANGVMLWCTVGDAVAPHHVAQWRSRWVVELSWSAFTALRLDENNVVTVWVPTESSSP